MQWHNCKQTLLLCLLTLVFLAGCEQVSFPPEQGKSGHDFYPLNLGDFRIYDVYRIDYNFASANDTLVYQVKEWVSDAYLNQEGDTSFILQQFSRAHIESNWQLDSVFHVRRTLKQAIELINNQHSIKLVFPPQEGKSWNSKLLMAAEADSFRMVNVYKPFQLSDSLYENTLTVLERNIQDTIVRQDIRKVVYGHQIGPLYRLQKSLNYCATEACIGQGIINSGLFLEMKLQSYGRE